MTRVIITTWVMASRSVMSSDNLIKVKVFLLLAMLSGIAQAEPLVFTNAFVYTVDSERSVAEAIAIDENGVIAGIGSNEDILARFGAGIDLEGAMILPGFHDVHVHAIEAGITSRFCVMPQFASARSYLRELRICEREQQDWPWVIAAGVNMAALLEEVKDPRALADQVINDKPLLVLDDLGHGAWANSTALSKAGFSDDAGTPRGSILIRDQAGQLNGVVLEGAAQILIDAAQSPDYWFPIARDSLNYALEQFAANGITSISDAGGYWSRDHDRVWYEAERVGDLSVRASNALYVYPHMDVDQQVRALTERYSNEESGLVRFNQVKLYVDGILSQTTGLVSKPYISDIGLPIAGSKGFSYFPQDTLAEYAHRLTQNGFQLHIHITGDAGVKLALDVIEAAHRESGPHRITHLYLVDNKDIPRFVDLGVIADFQVPPSAVDGEYMSYMRGLIGARVNELLPVRTMLDAGVEITLSSDRDADELSPLIKLQTVTTRARQRVELEDALEMMTINAASMLKQDHLVGSLEVGKLADLVILSEDLFEVPADELGEVEVIGTMLEGELVYDPSGLLEY